MATKRKNVRPAKPPARLDVKALNAWAEAFHLNSKKHGFWDKTPDIETRVAAIPEKLCLIHSEVSEALEDFRKMGPTATAADLAREVRTMFYNIEGKPEGMPSELADIVIRTMELASALGIDIGNAIKDKHEYNKSRPYRHGGKRI